MWGETPRTDGQDRPKSFPNNAPMDQLDLGVAALETADELRARVAAERERDNANVFTRDPKVKKQVEDATREAITKLAIELLMNAGEKGVGFDEVREAAERRTIIAEHTTGRELSYGAALMRKIGGVPVRYRKSRNKSAQRRRVAVYVHKSFHPTAIALAE